MADQKNPSPKVEHKKGEFQIELPKEVLDQIPFLFRGPVKQFVDSLNNLDLNHDEKADVAQIAPVVIAILPLINWQKLVGWLVQNFAHDKGEAEKLISEASKLVSK